MAADMAGQVEIRLLSKNICYICITALSIHAKRFCSTERVFECFFHLQIKLWDLRKLRCVKEYRGHHNEHAILPLHVNEEEGLLTAGMYILEHI